MQAFFSSCLSVHSVSTQRRVWFLPGFSGLGTLYSHIILSPQDSPRDGWSPVSVNRRPGS